MPSIARWLIITGLISIGIGIVIGAVVTPWGFVIAGSGLIDFVLAYVFASGRLKGYSAAPEAAGAADEVAGAAPADPTYNPYARED